MTIVLVTGNRKLKQTLVRRLVNEKLSLKIKDSKLASPNQVLSYTGYEVGSVPPLIENIKIVFTIYY